MIEYFSIKPSLSGLFLSILFSIYLDDISLSPSHISPFIQLRNYYYCFRSRYSILLGQGVITLKRSEVLSEGKITENQLRSYIRFGLLQSKTVGHGRGRSVHSEFPENTLEVIRAITLLRTSPFIKKIQDLTCSLFWLGYPISLYQLKEQLNEFLNKAIINSMKDAVEDSHDQRILNESLKRYHSDLRKLGTENITGRPSKEVEQIRDSAAERETEQLLEMLPILQQFLFNDYTSVKGDADLRELNLSWLSLEYLSSCINSLDEYAIDEIYGVVELFKPYIEITAKLLSRKFTNEDTRNLVWFLPSRPQMIKLALIILSIPDWRHRLKTLFISEDTMSFWVKSLEKGVSRNE